jgi:hypothetical protein
MVTGRRHQPKAGDAAHKGGTGRADAWVAKLRPTIKALQAAGITSLNGIARALNGRGIPPPRRRGAWQAAQVARALARLAENVGKATTDFEESAEIMPGASEAGYHVVVAHRGVLLWEWEIYRNGEPPPARARDGP